MNIYIVRHTDFENPENIFPFHLPLYLSQKGRKDALKIGQWSVRQKLSTLPIFTSPIVRCVQTSEIIASQTKSFVRIDKRLIEVACPDLEGKPRPKKEDWIIHQDDPSREKKTKVIARMIDIITEKVKDNQDCVFVSHGEPLTYTYWHLTGKKFLRYPWDPKHKDKIIQRGEIIRLEFEKGSFKKATEIDR